MLVEFEQSGGIGILHLRRPESANALNGEILRQIYKLQVSLRRDRQVRALITVGEGKGFCAGSDLNEQAKFSPDASREIAASRSKNMPRISAPAAANHCRSSRLCSGRRALLGHAS